MSASVKKPKIELRVNGIPRRCYGVATNAGTNGISASFSVNPAEGYILPNAEVEIDLGYVEGTHMTFSGIVVGNDDTLNPWWEEVRCGGKLRKINDRINVEDPSASETPTTGVLPILVDEG